jgi:hypothetical protein
MTSNPINQPFQPFHVQSSLLNDAPKRDSNTPQGPAGPQTPNGSGPWDPFGDPGTSYFGLLAVLGFFALYTVTQRYVELAPLTVAVLIACVLLRLGARERQFAAVPVALAGIKLALELTGSVTLLTLRHTVTSPFSNQLKPEQLGVTWLPLFFSVCLFYMPKRISVTSKITLACSLILLVSGLLPGDGYLYMFATVQNCLFLAIAIGLVIDFVPKHANGAAQTAGHGVRP